MNRKEKRRLKKKLYAKLEANSRWRLAKVLFWVTAAILTFISVASVDDYSYGDDSQRWANFITFTILSCLAYFTLRRLVFYITYGKLKLIMSDLHKDS